LADDSNPGSTSDIGHKHSYTVVTYLLTSFCCCQVYATGYGAGGRLGVGSTDSIACPTLLESIQHVFIKKLAVNSGGKHCLALSAEGEVFSWGEGEDGKLGHGNRKFVSVVDLHVIN